MAIKKIDYTPQTIADIVFQSDATRDFIADIVSDALPFPSGGKNGILLYGTFGTGKSALAKLLPDAIEQVRSGEPAYTRYEPIQQGNNGAAVIKSMWTHARLVPITGKHQYFVLDEVDNLNAASMASLKSVMNTQNAIFVLTTNCFYDIDPGVRNRCHRVEFNAAPADRWLPFVKRVHTDQSVIVPADSHLLPIIGKCNGSARDITFAAFRSAAKCTPKPQQPPAAVVPASASESWSRKIGPLGKVDRISEGAIPIWARERDIRLNSRRVSPSRRSAAS